MKKEIKKEKTVDQKNKIPKWVILVIALVIIFIALPFTIITGVATKYLFTDYQNKIEEKGNYTIIDDALRIDNTSIKSFYDKESNSYYITGSITNILKDENRHYIDISYDVFDKDGNLLGTANAYIDNLCKGKTWKFKAIYTDIDSKEIVNYKLNSIEHYNF